jgi:hypothetical protein
MRKIFLTILAVALLSIMGSASASYWQPYGGSYSALHYPNSYYDLSFSYSRYNNSYASVSYGRTTPYSNSYYYNGGCQSYGCNQPYSSYYTPYYYAPYYNSYNYSRYNYYPGYSFGYNW